MKLKILEGNKASYGRVLKSSSIMGGAAGVNLIFGMLRVKFAAIYIGPIGIALLANFNAIQGLMSTIFGLGVQTSAVRDVVAAAEKNDLQAIGRSILTLRRICWITGVLGALTMMLLSPLLSQWTFGSNTYTFEIASLGICILLGNLAGGQIALLQGLRRISDLARINIIGSVVSTVASIGLYVGLGVQGIVPSLLIITSVQLAASWFFSNSLTLPKVEMTWRESIRESGGMVRLGLAFMWTALLGSIAVVITNALITHQISLAALGIYSAAFALSGMFVNFVLSAMATDYYPRLTGLSPDKKAMNQLVNEQTEIALLLAVPGLMATISFAYWIIHMFYSSAFLPATEMLQWFALGCLIRVIQWPMGFLQLALGKSFLFFCTQTLFTCMHLLLIWIGLVNIGIEGVSIAFVSAYGFSLGVILLVARNLTGFFWSPATRHLLAILLAVVGVSFILVRLLPLWAGTIVGIVATLIASVLCLRGLVSRIGLEHRLTRFACQFLGVRFICGLSNTLR